MPRCTVCFIVGSASLTDFKPIVYEAYTVFYTKEEEEEAYILKVDNGSSLVHFVRD